MPGVSRSGICYSTGLYFKINKKKTAEYTFLLSIPIIIGAGCYKLKDCLNKVVLNDVLIYLIGFFTAFVVGLVAIYIFMNFVVKSGFKYFIIYRILLGILLFLFFVF
jgi:undecaprenyl-diphosphatase